MAQNANSTGLFTTVRNVSGHARTFGFLGQHGMRLAAGETVTVPGDLVSKLGNMTSQRRFKALQKALDDNSSLEILSSPAVYLLDATTGQPKQLALDNGVLGVVDPAWMSSGSSDFSEA